MDPTPTQSPQAHTPLVTIIERDAAIAALFAERLSRDHIDQRTINGSDIPTHRVCVFAASDAIICGEPSPSTSQIELVRSIASRTPSIPILALVPATEPECASRLYDAGAAAVVIRTPGFLDQLAVTTSGLIRHARGSTLHLALHEIRNENRTLQRLIERLEGMTMKDPLTGVASRRAAESQLVVLFATAKRYKPDLACILFDLDQLKQVNDTLGHAAGDALLKAAASAMTTECRKSDVVARIGGDEFVLLLPHTPAAAAMNLATRILQTFQINARPIASRLGAAGRSLGLSAGVSCTGMTGARTEADLLNLADEAMYAAKHAGGSTAVMSGRGDRPALLAG